MTDLTKPQLLAYAAEAGIPGVDSSMKKAEILTVMEEALL